MNTLFPYHLEMELELLGMLILKDGDAVPDISAILSPEDFYSYEHQLIYSAIIDLYNSGTSPTMLNISDWLKRKNYIFKGEGDTVSPFDKVRVDTIVSLGQAAFTNAYAESYAIKLKEASNRDKLIQLGKELQDKAADITKDFSDIILYSEKAFNDIIGNTNHQQLISESQYLYQ